MASPRRYMPSEWRVFGEILNDLLREMPAGLKAGPRLTALIVAGFEARHDGDAHPALGTIAGLAGCSTRAVQDHLNKLHDTETVATYPSLGETSNYVVTFRGKPIRRVVPSAESAPHAESADDPRTPEPRSPSQETAKAAAAPAPALGVGQGGSPEGCTPLRDLLGDFGEAEAPNEPPEEALPPPPVDEQLEPKPVPSDARSRPSPARCEDLPTTSRPHDLALCGRVPPTLSDELKAALLRLPGGTGAYVMLARKHLTAEEAEYVVRRALAFADRCKRENDPLRDVRGITQKTLGDVFDRRIEARERQEAERHDAPFDPDDDRPKAPPRPHAPGPRKTEPPKALRKPVEDRDSAPTARIRAIELELRFRPSWDGADERRAALERELAELRAKLDNKDSAA